MSDSDTGKDLEEEKVMNEFLQKLQSEQPKIDQSLKNFLSIMAGKYSSMTIETRVTPVKQSELPLEDSISVMKKSSLNIQHFAPNHLLSFVKLFLQVLQSTPLLTYQEYRNQHPQKPDERAIDYLDKLCHYKAIYFLREKVIHDNLKVSKVFGKDYFLKTNIFPDIKSQVLSKIREGSTSSASSSISPSIIHSSGMIFNEEELNYLLQVYEESIFGSTVTSSTGVAEIFKDEDDHYNELIWSKNFQDDLHKQQKKRIAKIEERKKEQEQEEEQVVELKDSSEDGDEHDDVPKKESS
jgi:hypothetical protein